MIKVFTSLFVILFLVSCSLKRNANKREGLFNTEFEMGEQNYAVTIRLVDQYQAPLMNLSPGQYTKVNIDVFDDLRRQYPLSTQLNLGHYNGVLNNTWTHQVADASTLDVPQVQIKIADSTGLVCNVAGQDFMNLPEDGIDIIVQCTTEDLPPVEMDGQVIKIEFEDSDEFINYMGNTDSEYNELGIQLEGVIAGGDQLAIEFLSADPSAPAATIDYVESISSINITQSIGEESHWDCQALIDEQDLPWQPSAFDNILKVKCEPVQTSIVFTYAPGSLKPASGVTLALDEYRGINDAPEDVYIEHTLSLNSIITESTVALNMPFFMSLQGVSINSTTIDCDIVTAMPITSGNHMAVDDFADYVIQVNCEYQAADS
jgi:hypothetical protein